jgi:hypothetical protein
MDKRYQVFLSSTYADLKTERQKVIQALMELDCIPAGMELFPAMDEEQLEFIKRVIDDCDYYLLIIGGRYGSLTAAGVSYTEQEYDYAVSKGIKVVGLLHGSPEDISVGKTDISSEMQEKLKAFRDKVSTGRLVRFWQNAEELPGIVALSLAKTMKTFPAVGWIRGDRSASEDLLNEINTLRKSNLELESRLKQVAPNPIVEVVNLAGLDEKIKIHGNIRGDGSVRPWSVEVSWESIFGFIAPYLIKHPHETTVKGILTKAFVELRGIDGYSPAMIDQDFQTIALQLRTLGLVDIKFQKSTDGTTNLYWYATNQGDLLMYKLRTIKTSR